METMRACVRALLVGLMTGLLCPVVSACPIALCRVGATYVNGSAAAGPAAIETITVNLPGLDKRRFGFRSCQFFTF